MVWHGVEAALKICLHANSELMKMISLRFLMIVSPLITCILFVHASRYTSCIIENDRGRVCQRAKLNMNIVIDFPACPEYDLNTMFRNRKRLKPQTHFKLHALFSECRYDAHVETLDICVACKFGSTMLIICKSTPPR